MSRQTRQSALFSDTSSSAAPDVLSYVDTDSAVHIAGTAKGGNTAMPVSELIEVMPGEVGVLMIRPSAKRPPTILDNQGRHISAYALLVQALLRRIEGKEIKACVPAILAFLKEYISNEVALNKYEQFVEEISSQEEIYKKSDRRNIDMHLHLSNSLLDPKFYPSLEQLPADDPLRVQIEKYKKELTPVSVTDRKKARDLLKESGELKQLGKILNTAIAFALRLLNKMSDVAFKGSVTTAAESEGSVISGAMTVLDGFDGTMSQKNIKTCGKAIANLFDYPAAEVDEPDKQGSLCRNIIRRHIKLVFDAFPKLRPVFLDEVQKKILLLPLMEKVRSEFGWGEVFTKSPAGDPDSAFKKTSELPEIIMRYLKIDQQHCLFSDDSRKFNASLPKSTYTKSGTARKQDLVRAQTTARQYTPGGRGS